MQIVFHHLQVGLVDKYSCNILTVADNIMLYCRYAVLDFGTNYCNMRNLIDGAG